MNRVCSIFCSILVAILFQSCVSSDGDLSRLPSGSRAFLEKHFSGVKVVSVEQTLDNDFDVRLENGVIVEFERRGTWNEVNAKKHEMPLSLINLLPSQTIQYIKDNYPDRTIRKIERKNYGYSIQLNKPNPLKMKFNKGGAFLSVEEDF